VRLQVNTSVNRTLNKLRAPAAFKFQEKVGTTVELLPMEIQEKLTKAQRLNFEENA
jgi:hypothetical protein